MVLQFLCPNGHKVHCPEDRAGLAAKCPRCGVKFRIPTIEELGSAGQPEAPTESSVKAGSSSGGETTASGVDLGTATGPDEIEFLCPNDHLLHGPAALQGRPGRCPQCGSRFRIPSYQDQDEFTAEASEPSAEGGGSTTDASAVELAGSEQELGEAGSAAATDALAAVAAASGVAGGTSLSGTKHPAAQLVGRLWRFKAQGATVEIRYGEGHRLTPDEFIRGLASPTHGVFAVKEPNGTFTLTAMPWDSIQVVIARGVRQLSED